MKPPKTKLYTHGEDTISLLQIIATRNTDIKFSQRHINIFPIISTIRGWFRIKLVDIVGNHLVKITNV